MIRSRLRWEIGAALAAKTILLLALYAFFFSSGHHDADNASAVSERVLGHHGR